METLIAPIINLLILIVFLGYKLREPIRSFVAQRHSSIRNDVQSVRDQLQQAQVKYDELSAKLKAIDVETALIRSQMEQEGLASKKKITQEAQMLAGTLVSDAKESASSLFEELRMQLYSDLVNQVLDRAEVLLSERLTGDDRLRICQEFSLQMERIQ